jgi:hypothetical protein
MVDKEILISLLILLWNLCTFIMLDFYLVIFLFSFRIRFLLFLLLIVLILIIILHRLIFTCLAILDFFIELLNFLKEMFIVHRLVFI